MIIAPPLSINVTLRATATFQCTSEGGALYWIINGTSSPSEWDEGINYDTRQSGTYQTSTLSIPAATEFRNNMLIRCAVNSIESDTASLLIQDKSMLVTILPLLIIIGIKLWTFRFTSSSF